MKKVLAIIIVLIGGNNLLKAQQELTLNDINFRRGSYNLAYIVNDESLLDATFTTSTGNGEQNAARFHFSAYGNSMPLQAAAGIKLNTKSYGLYQNTSIEGMFAKGIDLGKTGDDAHHLNLGVSIGILLNSIRLSELNQFANTADPFLSNTSNSRYFIGFGIAYEHVKHSTIGFSALPSVVKSRNGYFPVYIGNVSHRFYLNEHYFVEPEFLFYASNVSRLTMEGNLKLGFDERYWIKAGMRTTNTVVLGAFYKHSVVNVGYVYNHNRGDYSFISPRVHNIDLGVKINRKKGVAERARDKRNSKRRVSKNSRF